MTRIGRLVTSGLAGVVVLLGSAAPLGGQTLKLSLHIQNQADIQNDVLADAEEIVTRIFAAVGVEATFVDGEADVTIKLLSRHTENGLRRDVDTVGFAPSSESERGHVAYVFQSRVDRIAEGYSAVRAVVLGAAIAHEVGHLLLPLNAHSKTGIMQPTWSQLDFRRALHGQLLFTSEQAAQIRRRLINALPQ